MNLSFTVIASSKSLIRDTRVPAAGSDPRTRRKVVWE